jgi:hypothetical protein
MVEEAATNQDTSQATAGSPPPSDPPPAEPSGADTSAAPDAGADKSLADGGGKSDPADQPVPATWPEDWRQRFAGSDETALKTLNRWKDPGNIWKSYQALRQQVDSGELRKARPGADNEKALADWRAEMGVPEKPEGYREGLPDALKNIPEADKPIVDHYLQIAHKSDATPDEVARGLDAYYQIQEQQGEALREQDRKHRTEAEDNLRAEWGPEYRANLNAMHSLFDTHGSDGLRERLFTARFNDGSLLGDDPEVLQFLVGMAREVNPHGTVTPQPGQSQVQAVDTRIAELEVEMSDTKGRAPNGYWNSPAKQEEYRRLLAIKDKASRAA